MKPCIKCREIKPLTAFYLSAKAADGHFNTCKECAKAAVRRDHATKREHYSAYNARRQRTPERRKAHQEAERRYRKQYPDKYKARAALNNAVQSGRLVRQPCEACGDKRSHGHHHDYSKPLDVRWLCFKHHLAEHGKIATREWSCVPNGAA